MPEILKWLRRTRGTQYASIHGTCVHARIIGWSLSNEPIYEVKNSFFRVNRWAMGGLEKENGFAMNIIKL